MGASTGAMLVIAIVVLGSSAARSHACHVYKHEPARSKLVHSFRHDTMFKGILPPRRIPSPEFTIVSPLLDNGKENLPTSPPLHTEASPNAKVPAAAKSGKAVQDKPKRKKGGDVLPHTAPIANSTDHEFDRLLVRAIAAFPQSPKLLLIFVG
jgi:hypothetical protein